MSEQDVERIVVDFLVFSICGYKCYKVCSAMEYPSRCMGGCLKVCVERISRTLKYIDNVARRASRDDTCRWDFGDETWR